MKTERQPAPISDLLRRTIAKAVESGRTSYKALERETGVNRASVMRFVTGRRFLRLDLADRLAAYFGLELKAERGDNRRKGIP
jgi:plasmid maintenance system antidote protein VapI